MNLTKMDSFARKMNLHAKAFSEALDLGDAELAKAHLQEVLKVSNFLNDDLHYAIQKSAEEKQVNEFANGVPVMKFNERGTNFDTSQRDRVLKGTVIPARTNYQMRKHSGTFGGWQK